MARMEERTHGRRAAARKEVKGKGKVARENPERVGRVARQDTLQLGAGKEETKIYTSWDEDDSENVEESTENEDDLQACVCWKKVKMNSGRR